MVRRMGKDKIKTLDHAIAYLECQKNMQPMERSEWLALFKAVQILVAVRILCDALSTL